MLVVNTNRRQPRMEMEVFKTGKRNAVDGKKNFLVR